jgi:hypothetical protein
MICFLGFWGSCEKQIWKAIIQIVKMCAEEFYSKFVIVNCKRSVREHKTNQLKCAYGNIVFFGVYKYEYYRPSYDEKKSIACGVAYDYIAYRGREYYTRKRYTQRNQYEELVDRK